MKLSVIVLFLTVIALFSAQNIRIQSFTFIPACKSDNDCLSGYYCNSSLVCQDRCITMKCTATTVCKDGGCRQICDDKTPCPDGHICTMGYCMDKCRYMECKSGYKCELGACVTDFAECTADKNCKTGFYCSKDSKCVDKCSKENYCKEDEICEKGECKKEELPCIDPKCPKRYTCSDPRPNETTCPTLYFFRKPDPVVCGVTKNGKLVDYPVECYACKDTTIIYYFNVTCDEVPKNCTKKNNGKICSDEIKCTNPRPNYKTCPNLTWIREPDPLVCGVNKHGEYVDFPVECYACREKNISFYYNKTCAEVRKKATTLSCSQVSCEVGFTCKEGKCVDPPSRNLINCTEPRPTDDNCPTVYFIRKPDPVACGITKTGELKNFEVECYACKSTDIVGYHNTSCDNVDEVKCADVKCKEGEKCVDGECLVTKWPVCEKDVKKQECGKDRPTEESCPLIYFFLPPPNIVCGVTSTNERISYPVECYACKNTDVLYYYNKSCEQLSEPCDDNSTTTATTTTSSTTNGGRTKDECTTDTDCENGFSCEDKKCFNKCAVTLCPAGTECLKGECIKPGTSPSKSCSTIRCREGFRCEDGECIDKCKDIFCIATHTCVNGECVPIPI